MPSLFCQGFQRGFTDPESPFFSESAAFKRDLLADILAFARRENWNIIHGFLPCGQREAAFEQTLPGFEPRQAEPYFKQDTLSAFLNRTFAEFAEDNSRQPIFTISLSGITHLTASFFDGIERQRPLTVVLDAVCDFARSNTSETQQIEAVTSIAEAHGYGIQSQTLLNANYNQSITEIAS